MDLGRRVVTMPYSATPVVRHCCRSADVRHCGPDGALQPSYSSYSMSASLLHLRMAVVA
jgi:hypothetical protein